MKICRAAPCRHLSMRQDAFGFEHCAALPSRSPRLRYEKKRIKLEKSCCKFRVFD